MVTQLLKDFAKKHGTPVLEGIKINIEPKEAEKPIKKNKKKKK